MREQSQSAQLGVAVASYEVSEEVVSLETVAGAVISGVGVTTVVIVSVTVCCVGSTMTVVVPLTSTVYVPGANVGKPEVVAGVVVVEPVWHRSQAGLVTHWK